MQAFREIMDSSLLKNVLSLPEEMQNRKVEIIILLADSTGKKTDFHPEEYIGTFHIEDIDTEIASLRNEWDRL